MSSPCIIIPDAGGANGQSRLNADITAEIVEILELEVEYYELVTTPRPDGVLMPPPPAPPPPSAKEVRDAE